MARASSTVAGVALLGVLAPSRLGAQVCAGFPGLDATRFRVAASAAAYSYATALEVSFTAGKTVHGTFGVGKTRDAELDASTYDFRLAGGVDVALDPERRAFLCPVAALPISFGPHNPALWNVDYRRVGGELGIGLAVQAARFRGGAVLPTAGLRLAWLTVTKSRNLDYEDPSASWTASDVYMVFSLGVGVVLHEILTFRPGITVPFGLMAVNEPTAFAVPFGREEGEVALEIGVGFSFGRRARAIP